MYVHPYPPAPCRLEKDPHRSADLIFFKYLKVLARVQAFLPQMEASNAILSQADPRSVDIENVTEADHQYIEMVRLLSNHVSHFPSPSFCLCTAGWQIRTSAWGSSKTETPHLIPTLPLPPIFGTQTHLPHPIPQILTTLPPHPILQILTTPLPSRIRLPISCCQLRQGPSSNYPSARGHVRR